MSIGYLSPDWGMAGYYAQEDAAQKWEEYQEYLYDQERKNYETNKERVLQFAAKIAKAYQDEWRRIRHRNLARMACR